MTSVAATFVGGCVLIYLPVLSPMIARDQPHNPGWTVFAVLVQTATALAVLVALARRDRSWLRSTLWLFSGGYVVCEALWRPMWDGSRFAQGHWQWLTAYTALAVVALAPFLRPVWVWTAHTLLVLGCQATTIGVSPTPYVSRCFAAWVIAGFAVAVAVIVFETARERDAEEEAAREQAAAAGAAEAMEIERERVDGLIHDSVMSTLLFASRASEPRVVAEGARQALDQLEALRAEETVGGALGAESLSGLLHSSLSYVDPGAEVNIVVDGSGSYPGAPARALVAAATEAARNCALHAPDARHRVDAALLPGRVTVTITDDGPGFDLSAVPPDRLGVRWSILGRMRSVRGGEVDIEGIPGRGTTVRLGLRA